MGVSVDTLDVTAFANVDVIDEVTIMIVNFNPSSLPAPPTSTVTVKIMRDNDDVCTRGYMPSAHALQQPLPETRKCFLALKHHLHHCMHTHLPAISPSVPMLPEPHPVVAFLQNPTEVSLSTIDDNHVNPLAEWRKMGSPMYPTSAQIAQMQKAAEVVPTKLVSASCGANCTEVTVTVAPQSINLAFLSFV